MAFRREYSPEGSTFAVLRNMFRGQLPDSHRGRQYVDSLIDITQRLVTVLATVQDTEYTEVDYAQGELMANIRSVVEKLNQHDLAKQELEVVE